MVRTAAVVLILTVGACSTTPRDAEQAQPAGGDYSSTQEPQLPPGAEQAAERLATSPRHGEWAMIAADGDSVRAWVVYPERSGPAPVVLVIHEIYGVTSWIRGVADQLAADGFIAIAPDLLTGRGIPVDSAGEPVREAATAAIRALEPARYQRQLAAIGEWGMGLPAAARSYGIVGFCWGGAAAFAHAAMAPGVGAAVVYYGSSPAAELLQRVQAPVLGLYGGDDERVNATVPAARAELERLGRSYRVHMFDGAGHGFLRQQQGRDGANMAATREAWPLTVAFFREHLRGG